MRDETSIFGAKPERLDRLVFEALQDSEAEQADPTASLSAVLERPGGQIGRYKLLSVLGEGGMGIVYLAEQQEPIRRKVALKVIKPGMDSKRVMARFEAERQTLALLDHPNIAHVYDAGTTEAGRPFFVMEHVKGLPITEYCDRHRLTIEERLRLFQQVCQAVQHAHQKGIIHRDIKPSNILVFTQDDQATPRIIDFGVAKALAQPLTERTLATEDSQLLGTPEYMSPEQADMANEDIDTRSDVYSLGVLLYVLLTGVLPFDSDTLREGGIENTRKTIRETDPKTPSTRLKKLGEEALSIAQNRRMEVQTLAKHLKKELEWIPLKAMRKERSERYRSASELGDDIRNYLSGSPLIAGPESVMYRVGKLIHRYRGTMVAATLILATLVLGFVTSTVLFFRAENARMRTLQAEKDAKIQRDRAEDEAKKAAEQAEAYRNALYASNLMRAHIYQDKGDKHSARALLYTCPVDLRGWEWYYLWGDASVKASGANDPNLCRPRTLTGHSGSVESIALNHDGTRLVSGSKDRTVRVWDVQSGTKLMDLQDHLSPVKCVVYSPDSKTIATACEDETIKLFDAETGRELHSPSRFGGRSVAFSQDGKSIAIGSRGGNIHILESVNCKYTRTLESNCNLAHSLNFFGNDNRLICSSWNHLQILNLDAPSKPIDLNIDSFSWSIAVSRTPRTLIASGGYNGTVQMWNGQSGQALNMLHGHSGAVRSVAFSPDAQRVVSASSDGTIRIWDTTHGNLLATLDARSGSVEAVAFDHNNSYIASGYKDGKIRIWPAATKMRVAKDLNMSARHRDAETGKLIAWWQFDEKEGTVAEDSSGHGLDGQLAGDPQRVPGRIGNALKFDGQDDYVDCGDNPLFNLTGSITLAAWIKFTTGDKESGPIIKKGSAWCLTWYSVRDQLHFDVSHPDTRPLLFLNRTGNLNDGQWYHVAATYNGYTLCLYLNGKLETSCPANPVFDIDVSSDPVCIGSADGITDSMWKGLIDDVRIYNYALTPEEIVGLIPSQE